MLNRIASYLVNAKFHKPIETPKEEDVCPSCHETFTDPVIHDGSNGDKHPFDRHCIIAWTVTCLKNRTTQVIRCPSCAYPIFDKYSSTPYKYAIKWLLDYPMVLADFTAFSNNFFKEFGKVTYVMLGTAAGISLAYQKDLLSVVTTAVSILGCGALIGIGTLFQWRHRINTLPMDERLLFSALIPIVSTLGTIAATSVVGATLWAFDQSNKHGFIV